MDSKSLRTFQILDELAGDSRITQRDLSRRIGVALGLVNRHIQRLVKKGYLEVAHVEKNRLHYLLTPKGIKERSALSCRYLRRSYRLFKDLRERTTSCFQKLAKEGARRVVFFGTSEVAEVAFLSLYSAGLEMAGVADDDPSRVMFFGYPVRPIEFLKDLDYDKLIIVQLDYDKNKEDRLLAKGISGEKICWLGDGQ